MGAIIISHLQQKKLRPRKTDTASKWGKGESDLGSLRPGPVSPALLRSLGWTQEVGTWERISKELRVKHREHKVTLDRYMTFELEYCSS